MTFTGGDGDDVDDRDERQDLDDGDDTDDRPAARPAPPTGRRRSGCLVPVVVFVLCMILGFVVAASVRGNDDDDAQRETLEEGSHGGDSYEIEGYVDEQGARCVHLLRDGELNTGACDNSAEEAIVGDRSVIFGQVPSSTVSVRIPLSNGDLGSAEVQEKADYRWYSITVPQDVDIDGEPTFVDADGGTN